MLKANLLPYQTENNELLDFIDKMMRAKKSIDDILKITNEVILKQHYGLTQKEVDLAHSIWGKLSKCRLNRNK